MLAWMWPRTWSGGGVDRGGGGWWARGRGRGRGRGAGPREDMLMENPYLTFEEGSEAFHICEKFRRMEIGGHAAIGWGALDEVDESARARLFIGHDTPWERYSICNCFFFVLYTTCVLTTLCDRPANQPEKLDDPWIEVSFRLAGQWHVMSIRQFAEHCGLYRVEELDTPINTDGIHMAACMTLLRFWQRIRPHRFGPRSKSRSSCIPDPLYRYLHKLIATSIAPREKSREWCNQGDLFYLYYLRLIGADGEVFAPTALPDELPKLRREPAQGEGQPTDGDAAKGDDSSSSDDDDGDPANPPPPPPPPFPIGAPPPDPQPHGVPQYPLHVLDDELDPAVARALDQLEVRMDAAHDRMERLIMQAIQALRGGEQPGPDHGAGTSGTPGAGPSATT
ncbi:hypothetical protein Hanom_Chr17g01566241 [Helianthus anomalus]